MSSRPRLALDRIHDRQTPRTENPGAKAPAAAAPAKQTPAPAPSSPTPAAEPTELATFTVGVPAGTLQSARDLAREVRIPFRVLVTAALSLALEQPDSLRARARETVLAETAARLKA